jgi:uncharacterized repeat protein (TIGR02543 family)
MWAPPLPSREGYEFLGWYTDEAFQNEFDVESLNSDITLYAKWQIYSYSLIFRSYDGSIMSESTIPYDTLLSQYEPTFPIIIGYRFSRWDPILPESMPDSNLDISAHFDLIQDNNHVFTLGNEEIVDVSTSSYATAVVTASGKLYKWGREGNPDWLCGPYDDSFDTLTPRDISGYFELNVGEYIIQVELGIEEHLLLTNQGRIFEWSHCGICSNAECVVGIPLIITDLTSTLSLNQDEYIVQISFGGYQRLLLTNESRLLAMNIDEFGAYDYSDNTVRDLTIQFNLSENETFTKIIAGDMNSAVITSQGRLFIWGLNSAGMLGIGTDEHLYIPTELNSYYNLLEGETIKDVSLGYFHTLVVTSLNRVFACGHNAKGMLGNDSTISTNLPVEITERFNFTANDDIFIIVAGVYNSYLTTVDGKIFAWGSSTEGRLGGKLLEDQLTPLDVTDLFNLESGEIPLLLNALTPSPILITSDRQIIVWGKTTYGLPLY